MPGEHVHVCETGSNVFYDPASWNKFSMWPDYICSVPDNRNKWPVTSVARAAVLPWTNSISELPRLLKHVII